MANCQDYCGLIYRHYKDKYYLSKLESLHVENDEKIITYRALYGDMLYWSSPCEMFFGEIDFNGTSQKRFTQVKFGDAYDIQLLQMIEFASIAYRHTEYFGFPYINHLIEVAELIALYHPDKIMAIKAAILHDCILYTEKTICEIDTLFGRNIAEIVNNISNNQKYEPLMIMPITRHNIPSYLQKTYNTKNNEIEIYLIILAKILINCKEISKYNTEKLDMYLSTSKKIIDKMPQIITPLQCLFDNFLSDISAIIQ
jgi:hypothetical protein